MLFELFTCDYTNFTLFIIYQLFYFYKDRLEGSCFTNINRNIKKIHAHCLSNFPTKILAKLLYLRNKFLPIYLLILNRFILRYRSNKIRTWNSYWDRGGEISHLYSHIKTLLNTLFAVVVKNFSSFMHSAKQFCIHINPIS